MTLRTSKQRKLICTYLSHIQKDYIINMDYERFSTNLYIHHVCLSTNLYVHYLRLSTSKWIFYIWQYSQHLHYVLQYIAFWAHVPNCEQYKNWRKKMWYQLPQVGHLRLYRNNLCRYLSQLAESRLRFFILFYIWRKGNCDKYKYTTQISNSQYK